jgi:uncharacterized repeat protein (TIGR04076 family)
MNSRDDVMGMAKSFLNYTDAEIETLGANPKYVQMLAKAPELMNTELIFEVVDAHGCVCRHHKGQKIKINGGGSITCKESPSKICVYLVNAVTPIVYGAQEFIFAGLDPNELKFTRVGCFDNGAKCGGFGHVMVQFSARQN